MSLDLIDFLHGFFAYDPSQRIGAEQALGHPWLNGPCSSNAQLAQIMMKRTGDYDAYMDAALLINIEQHIKASIQIRLDLIKVMITSKPGKQEAVDATSKIMTERYKSMLADCIVKNDIETVHQVARSLKVSH